MDFQQTYRLMRRGGKRGGLLLSVRPVTLLVACGIVIAATLLIVTGLVAGYLRQQTLEASEAGLAHIDAVRHGGTISVDSEIGFGTSITIRLALEREMQVPA